MKNHVSLVLALVLVAGCNTVRHQADDALSKGDYLRAAALYERLAAESPKNATLKERLASARASALRQLLTTAQESRAQARGEIALQDLETLLSQRDAWQAQIPADVAAPFAAEVRADAEWLEGEVAAETAHAGALTAEATVGRQASLLAEPEFAATAAKVRTIVAAKGLDTCDALRGSANAGAPYTSWLVADYCAHFNGAPVATPPLPHLRGGVIVDGTIDGAHPDEVAAMRAAVEQGFAASVWHGGSATAISHAHLGGALALLTSAQPASLSASWTESVPYTTTETYQEPYDVSYTDTETYTESVPVTSTQYVPCDTGTCAETTTNYEMETKTRDVTRTRTEYRTATRDVTTWVDEPRIFVYLAQLESERFVGNLSAVVDEPGTTATLATDLSRSGYRHDVTFAPAGVHPQTPDLPTRAELIGNEAASLASEMTRSLDARYAAIYCERPSFTLEQAAACAYLDPTTLPEAAKVPLYSVLGNDASLLAPLLHR